MLDREEVVIEIRRAAGEVFATMLSTGLSFVEAHHDKAPAQPVNGVVCLIGMAGEWTGTGTLSCSGELACRIASLMLMAEYHVVDSDVLDAVAEVANMVIGNVKTALERHLGSMAMSVPTAIFGKNFLARSAGGETWTVVQFDCAGEMLEVKLFLKKAASSPLSGAGSHLTPVYLRS